MDRSGCLRNTGHRCLGRNLEMLNDGDDAQRFSCLMSIRSLGVLLIVSTYLMHPLKKKKSILMSISSWVKSHHRGFHIILFMVHMIYIYTWNPKQPFINGCFTWMIANLYIGNGCFTKHQFLNGCLGFQVYIIRSLFMRFATFVQFLFPSLSITPCQANFCKFLLQVDTVQTLFLV